MPRRQFIDKKTATTYALVHRAQNDPLVHAADAPQMVFAEVSGPSTTTTQYDTHPSSSASSYYEDTGASGGSRSRKVKQRGDLDDEFGFSFGKNEGQAAEQGVFFDDTAYDYMQHMRDLGAGDGEVAWVPAATASGQEKTGGKGKGKGKVKLEDALAGLELGGGAARRDEREEDRDSVGGVSLGTAESGASRTGSLVPEDMLPSEFVRRTTYQDQQDVPDAIAGFQPGMDPRLREVLEALEDEAYVDDDEDVFGELTGEGAAEEVDEDEWEGMFFDDEDGVQGGDAMQRFLAAGEEDDGWESDDTIKADNETTSLPNIASANGLPPADPNATPAADPSGGAWLSEYSKFKSSLKADKDASAAAAAAARGADAPTESLDRSALSSLATGGRKKKRKGAKTSTTNYSMTSSALARTDHQTLLDDRFDRLMANYDADGYDDEADEDGPGAIPETASLVSGASGVSRSSRISRASKADSMASGMSRASGISTYSRATDEGAPQLVRGDFDSIMDGFLGTQMERGGKSRRDIGIAPGRKGKRGATGEGLRELDEIRRGLGAARVR